MKNVSYPYIFEIESNQGVNRLELNSHELRDQRKIQNLFSTLGSLYFSQLNNNVLPVYFPFNFTSVELIIGFLESEVDRD